MSALILRDVAHDYQGAHSLGGVSLDVNAGELVALLGRSGSGKTTLLRAIAGLITPRAGQITLRGSLVSDAGRTRVPTERRAVGLVFQDYALFPSMSVKENVSFGLSRRDSARVTDLLERLGLASLADRRPASLSGGQQQRVALARALAPRPSVLLLDEPFANLDAGLRVELGVMLRDAVRDEGTAALLVSHDRVDALALADRVALLAPSASGGQLIRQGAPDAVYADPGSAEAALLTGDAWFLPAEVTESGARTALGVVGDLRGSPSMWLAIRPEEASFVPGDGAAVVRHAAFRGASTLLLVEDARLETRLLIAHPTPVAVGTAGAVTLDRGAWVDPPRP